MNTYPRTDKSIEVFARMVVIALVAGTLLPTALQAANVPEITLKAAAYPSEVVKVLTTCDARGCFTFGPRQSYHRPGYVPIGPTGPGQKIQRGAGPQRFLLRPRPPAALPSARLPAADRLFHRQSCMNRYRSYNPLTDSYIASGGRTVRCQLPERP